MNIFYSKKYQDILSKCCDCLPDSNKTFLITGATGLIGSFIVDLLSYANINLSKNYKIIAVSRNKQHLTERFSYNSSIQFIAQDIVLPINFSAKIDYIIHAASNADPKTYALYPVETITTNVIGTKNILDLAQKHDAIVLFTSTMEVYGESNSGFFDENSHGVIDFNRIRNGYPESKRVSELLCKSYADEYSVNSIIARLGYIFGPTMTSTDNKAVAQFLKNAIKDENIVLKSPGTQKRSYLNVFDTVRALLKVLIFGNFGQAYNISDEHSVITISNLASLIANKSKMKVIFDIPDELEIKGSSTPHDAILDNSLLKGLNWTPFFTLDESVSLTIDILKEIN